MIALILNGAISPWFVVSALGLIGIASSIWAADYFAREVWEIRSPHSFICGLSFGLSGISVVTLLEGSLVPTVEPLVTIDCYLYMSILDSSFHSEHLLDFHLLVSLTINFCLSRYLRHNSLSLDNNLACHSE